MFDECTPTDRSKDMNENSYFQHHTLAHVAEEIGRIQGNNNIEMIVQDPAYNETSKAVLKRSFLNFQIVDDPESFLAMDAHTMVLFFFVPFDVAEIALSLAGKDEVAGMMSTMADGDHQEVLEGKHVDVGGEYSDLHRLNSMRKWDWKKKCVVERIREPRDRSWYGTDGNAEFYVRLKDE